MFKILTTMIQIKQYIEKRKIELKEQAYIKIHMFDLYEWQLGMFIFIAET